MFGIFREDAESELPTTAYGVGVREYRLIRQERGEATSDLILRNFYDNVKSGHAESNAFEVQRLCAQMGKRSLLSCQPRRLLSDD